MDQRKLNDSANTLVDMAKVRRVFALIIGHEFVTL